MTVLRSYAADRWVTAASGFVEVPSAIDGRTVARVSAEGLDRAAMVRHAREVGGPALRALTFHQRADILRAVATALDARKAAYHALALETGATRTDNLVDIDGGIGTLFAYASRGRRELPSERFIVEGEPESLSKGGSFMGVHILTPLRGVAIHINAFNFPCWGLLEKLGPAILAGMPVITKPATATAYVAEAVVRDIVATGLLPPGSLQLLCGPAGDLLDHVSGQDVIAFTGSLATSEAIGAHPAIRRNAVRLVAERDSLNAAILGPDAGPGSPEFDLFVREVVREMTVKAGQKCTAIRRVFVPRAMLDAATEALAAALGRVTVGDPRSEATGMGALVSRRQRDDVRARIAEIATSARIVFGDPDAPVPGADQAGAFMSPVLLRCDDPAGAPHVHTVEAFGPVATLMPYRDLDEAAAFVALGEGSLVASLFTHDNVVATTLAMAIAAYHGRLLILDRDCAAESTGHGSPLPGLVHGGPGRAGGGEELGGMRAVHHCMQRTAIQGSPAQLAALTRSWMKGAPSPKPASGEHPFRLDYDRLAVGDTIETESRPVTLDDIAHFAAFTGDTFYAHMDEAAAAANPFFPGRVAHGYLLLSFAAGLFVDPAPGPVLANYGLDNLRFLKPVSPGDAIRVRLTAKRKTEARQPHYGEVRWDAEILNQNAETVARYDLLTMNARGGA